MGMTIDKAIAKIWHCIVSIRDCAGNKEFVEALELSVETMRKYQKIEEIMLDNLDDIHPLDRQPYRLSRIHEILLEGGKDGKIN